jgi:lysophospholipase L1-like esterase
MNPSSTSSSDLRGGGPYRLLRRGVLVFLPFLLVAGIGEIVTGQQSLYRPHERFVRHWPTLPAVYRYQPDVQWEGTVHGDLAAMLGPGAPRQTRHVVFSTDAQGFRNDPPSSKPLQLIVLGDSFAVGNGTTQRATLAARLLSSRPGTNLSMLGTPYHQFLNLRAEEARLEAPQGAVLVWLLLGANSLDGHFGSLGPAPPPPNALSRTHLAARDMLNRFTRGSRVRTVLLGDSGQRPVRRRGDVLFYEPYVARAARTREVVEAHQNFQALVDTFRAVLAMADKRGWRLLVATIPSKSEVYPWLAQGCKRGEEQPPAHGFDRAMEALAKAEGVAFFDLHPALSKAAGEEEELLYWRDDTHWNERGQEVAAAALETALSRLGR